MPIAAAGSAIIRASWPPPTTATTGRGDGGASDGVRGWPALTRRSVGAARRFRSGGADGGGLGGVQRVGRVRRMHLETEAVPTHGGDQARAARVVAQLAAYP